MDIEIEKSFVLHDGNPVLGLLKRNDGQQYLFLAISTFKSYEFPILCIECDDGVIQNYLNNACDLLTTMQSLLANGSALFMADLYEDELSLNPILHLDPKWFPEPGFMASAHTN